MDYYHSYSSYSLADDGLAIPELLVAGLLMVLRELATEEVEETGLRAPVVEELVAVGFLRPVDAAGLLEPEGERLDTLLTLTPVHLLHMTVVYDIALSHCW